MSNFNITGRIESISEPVKRTETFTVREFVLLVTNSNSQYPDYVTFQLTNNNTTIIDNFKIGDEVQVTFDIRGRKWNAPDGGIRYFNTLSAWRIQLYSQVVAQNTNMQQPMGGYPQQPTNAGFQQPQSTMATAQQPVQMNVQSPAPAGDDSDMPF